MPKIKDFLNTIYETNEFYKNIVKIHNIADPTDITQYPVLTREQLQENRYNMFSEGYKNKYFSQQLRRQSSSGSSGIPVNVYWDYKDYYSSMRVLWHKRLQYYGIRSSDRYVMFTLNALNTKVESEMIYYIKQPENILIINISLIHKNNDYEKLIALIDEFKPKWLYIQPFILQKLIYLYQQLSKTPPQTLKYIETVGELLSPELKQKTLDYFKISVAEMYGSEEMNGISYECPYHNLHILTDNVLVECKNDNGIHCCGKGEAIITNLTNKAMPLIRYNQGDEIILNTLSEPCLCGSSAPLISQIKGRSLDSIKINNEIELNSFMLLETMAEVINQYGDIITCYKYIYIKSERKLQCLIEIEKRSKHWYSNVKETIVGAFLKKLSPTVDICFEVSLMDNIHSYDKKHKVLEIKE